MKRRRLGSRSVVLWVRLWGKDLLRFESTKSGRRESWKRTCWSFIWVKTHQNETRLMVKEYNYVRRLCVCFESKDTLFFIMWKILQMMCDVFICLSIMLPVMFSFCIVDRLQVCVVTCGERKDATRHVLYLGLSSILWTIHTSDRGPVNRQAARAIHNRKHKHGSKPGRWETLAGKSTLTEWDFTTRQRHRVP